MSATDSTADVAAAAAAPPSSGLGSAFSTPVVPFLFRQDSVTTAEYWKSMSKTVTIDEKVAAEPEVDKGKGDAKAKPVVADQTLRDSPVDISSLFESGKFSDCVVIVGSKRFNLHRVVLALKSDFLAEALEKEREVTLPFPDPHDLFTDIAKYMYSNKMVVKSDLVVPLVVLTGQLRMKALNDQLSEQLSSMLSPDTAFPVMRSAMDAAGGVPLDHIIKACCDVLATTYHEAGDALRSHPFDIFSMIVASPKLTVKNEMQLVESLMEYIKANPDLSTDQIRKLLGCVCFSLFTKELPSLQENPIIQKYANDLLTKGVIARMEAMESSEGLGSLKIGHRYLTPELAWDRKAKGKLISFKSDLVIKKKNDCAASIRTTVALPASGRHYWEVKFNRSSMGKGGSLGSCYYIGVVVDDGKVDWENSLGEASQNWKKAWVIHDNNNSGAGEVKHGGSTRPYKWSYCSGDRIGVLVDRDARTIAFYKNGKFGGVAFKNLPLTGALYPAITIYNSDATAELASGMAVPVAGAKKSKSDSDSAAGAAKSDSESEKSEKEESSSDDEENSDGTEATGEDSDDASSKSSKSGSGSGTEESGESSSSSEED